MTAAPVRGVVRTPVPEAPWFVRATVRAGVFCASLLFLLLPVLVAARQVGAPARPDELARLARALSGAGSTDLDGTLALQFYRSFAGDVAALPDAPAERQALVAQARIGQGVALAGLTLLLYLVVALARGRLQALLACAALAALPAVAQDGHVLRPETPAALFAMFGVLLLQCVAHETRGRRVREVRTVDLSRILLAVCAMLAIGLAVATLPTSGALLLVPGVVLSIVAVHVVLRSGRVLRRVGWLQLPVRAINRRMLPWTAMALLTPAVALWLLSALVRGPVEALAGTPSEHGPWPASPWLAWPCLGLAAAGALAALLRAGGRLRRRGRVAPDLVLLVFCAVVWAGAAGAPPGLDRLPLAAATAVLLAEGVFVVLLFGQRWLGGRSRRAPLSA